MKSQTTPILQKNILYFDNIVENVIKENQKFIENTKMLI
jgi:hypothetical protein